MYRIGDILEGFHLNDGSWIPTKDNVADEATKWKKVPSFSPTEKGFKGPTFLTTVEEFWPDNITLFTEDSEEELRPWFLLISHVAEQPPIDIEGFACWIRLQRTDAWVLRFSKNLEKKVNGQELRIKYKQNILQF